MHLTKYIRTLITHTAAGVDAAHSVVVAELLALCAGAAVEGEPNVGVTDEVAGCCLERRPFGTLEERYWMGLS
jgi:hypothetical protein